jgi:nuclear pore complex protein Nup205
LTTITATLHQDSHNLQKMLLPLPESLCPLYVYESKMALLIGVASTSLGANELVAKGFVGTLSECKFIDQRSGHRDDALRTSLNTS